MVHYLQSTVWGWEGLAKYFIMVFELILIVGTQLTSEPHTSDQSSAPPPTHTPDTGHWSEVSRVPTIRSRGATSLGHHHQLQRTAKEPTLVFL